MFFEQRELHQLSVVNHWAGLTKAPSRREYGTQNAEPERNSNHFSRPEQALSLRQDVLKNLGRLHA